ncbi:MAG: hypothetical protein QOF89_3812 [Acidobacteriota bacterium]|jgi:hypothetical protein|nr:hypothetical protein [Acidobacteriota bacterium]
MIFPPDMRHIWRYEPLEKGKTTFPSSMRHLSGRFLRAVRRMGWPRICGESAGDTPRPRRSEDFRRSATGFGRRRGYGLARGFPRIRSPSTQDRSDPPSRRNHWPDSLGIPSREEIPDQGLQVVMNSDADRRAQADKPENALKLASLALAIARRLRGERCRSRLQGWCWGHLGNARRVATDFNGADKAFTRAWQLWRAGEPAEPAEPEWLPEWLLLSLEASLRHRSTASSRRARTGTRELGADVLCLAPI